MMRVGVLLLLALAAAIAQKPAVIRIDVNLVQVDAVVTDSKGRHVSDLNASDFEILQDGKPQAITNFSYIAGLAVAAPAATPKVPKDFKTAPPPSPPPAALQPAVARRTIALVVDDLGLSFASTAHVRDALRKFVDHQMQSGDLVAIIRSSAGMGALQQFTTDHALLHAAIDRVKFTIGRVGIDSFELAGHDTPAQAAGVPGQGSALTAMQAMDNDAMAELESTRQGYFLTGTLGALRYVIDGFRELPGRKSIVLFSESMQMFFGVGQDPMRFDRTSFDPSMVDAVRHLIDAANRASVVIYTIDPRGLQSFFPSAGDAVDGGRGVLQLMQQRSDQMFNSQQGLDMLASETGGLFIKNNNFVDDALRQVIADTEGYYLIGYHPDSDTFGSFTSARYHRVQVRLKATGLSVRSRSGFYGEPSVDYGGKPETRPTGLARALTSPFASSAIHVRLTALFREMPGTRLLLDGMLDIDARDLRFTAQPDGTRQATVEVVAMTFGESGKPLDQTDRTFTLQVPPNKYSTVLNQGLVCVLNQPLPRAGPYQLRIAVRDAASELIGSASQFIEVPDLSKRRLALSSMMLYEDVTSGADPTTSAAIRRFKPGAALSYDYSIFNARTSPHIEVQTRLFLDGKQIYAGQPMTPQLSADPATHHWRAGGHLTLATAIAPGDYVLQVIVTDEATGEKPRAAWQWMDFEVRR